MSSYDDDLPMDAGREAAGAEPGFSVPPNPTPNRSGRATWNRVMKLVRRIHLYSGLFLFPWVMLYGVTALLFNHPTYFPDVETRTFAPAGESGDPFGDLPQAGQVAAEIVDELNDQSERSGEAKYRLASSGYAEFTRSGVATVKDDDHEYTLVVSGTDGSGYVRVKPIDKEDTGPKLPKVKPAAAQELAGKLNAGLRRKLDELEVAAEKPAFRRMPELQFDMEIDGELHRVRYDAARGTLSALRPTSMRRYLLRMHMAHTYPAAKGPRWFWAVAVDVMFGAMVFWGISGIFMWWQIKKTRVLGALIVIASAGIAAWLALGMHTAISGP